MPLLRRFFIIPAMELPDPSSSSGSRSEGRDDDIVLKNLHTLGRVVNFRFGEEAIKRIPNIERLGLRYGEIGVQGSPPPPDHYCLHNLGHLHKLESLFLVTNKPLVHFGPNISFPHSLNELILYGTQLEWEDMTTKVGSLPLLQVLQLHHNSCIGPCWETVEGQFCSLKFLFIVECHDLEDWTTEYRTHFPRLERLVLRDLDKLNEIPSCMGDIPTLKLIKVKDCSDSAADSAQIILEEQLECENVDLKVEIHRR